MGWRSTQHHCCYRAHPESSELPRKAFLSSSSGWRGWCGSYAFSKLCPHVNFVSTIFSFFSSKFLKKFYHLSFFLSFSLSLFLFFFLSLFLSRTLYLCIYLLYLYLSFPPSFSLSSSHAIFCWHTTTGFDCFCALIDSFNCINMVFITNNLILV